MGARPTPPYYAVIFKATRSELEPEAYAAMQQRMHALVRDQPGFLGMDHLSDGRGAEMTVSYWDSEASIRAWKQNVEHFSAQRQGWEKWYSSYRVRVCRVERDYEN
ncbi:MAG: antibiotic biosynthesis monooxygenase [Gammaproteobacteria bacterium]|nr:antibiotic biosynthesis monooxygenase [Gammaproteobacteria bacterium]